MRVVEIRRLLDLDRRERRRVQIGVRVGWNKLAPGQLAMSLRAVQRLAASKTRFRERHATT